MNIEQVFETIIKDIDDYCNLMSEFIRLNTRVSLKEITEKTLEDINNGLLEKLTRLDKDLDLLNKVNKSEGGKLFRVEETNILLVSLVKKLSELNTEYHLIIKNFPDNPALSRIKSLHSQFLDKLKKVNDGIIEYNNTHQGQEIFGLKDAIDAVKEKL